MDCINKVLNNYLYMRSFSCTVLITTQVVYLHRWNGPDNKVVTEKVISEVKAQFPQFADGDIKGECCKKTDKNRCHYFCIIL